MGRLADDEWCRVTGAQNLPAELGGADALCAAAARAIELASPKPKAIEIKVVSPYLIAATVILIDNKRLPVIKIASSDRPLGRKAMQMLTDSIAAQIASQ
jgi:hypothetical protein